MARAVHRSGLVALGIATALMASCAFAAKDVVVAVGSNFTTLDPYDANDTLSQAVAKSFYQGLFGLDKEMKLKTLAESYTVSDDGITYTVKLREGIKFQDGTDFNAAAVKANLTGPAIRRIILNAITCIRILLKRKRSIRQR